MNSVLARCARQLYCNFKVCVIHIVLMEKFFAYGLKTLKTRPIKPYTTKIISKRASVMSDKGHL